LDAGALVGLQPDAGISIDSTQREALAYWLAARFIRSALPNKFNAAYEPVRDKLRKALKRLHACRAILVAFNEQADGRFDAEFTLVLDPASDQISSLQQGAQEMERLLASCLGFSSVAVSAKSADAVSLLDYWALHHFDAFDDVSVGQSAHAGPVNAP
jgi:HrpA-like RNA helicase